MKRETTRELIKEFHESEPFEAKCILCHERKICKLSKEIVKLGKNKEIMPMHRAYQFICPDCEVMYQI